MLLYVYQQLGIIFIPYLTIKLPLIEKIFITCCPEYPRIPILIIFQQTFQDNLLREFITGWSFSDHWRQSVIPAIYYDAYQNLATVKDELCARLVIYVCCPLKDPLPFCVALVRCVLSRNLTGLLDFIEPLIYTMRFNSILWSPSVTCGKLN